ncbi:hypothetical protein LTR53_007973 [Teratosphaeriaceae sp. CCFEE 6253]|nr:hypothetical protein LTR53_007973 [Teratosphaeriaceae sp. CCFEE 6253]
MPTRRTCGLSANIGKTTSQVQIEFETDRTHSDTMVLGKRKRAGTSRLETFATQLVADDSKRSFLDLLAELRDAVYELVCISTGGLHLSRDPKRKSLLASTSRLGRANKQIRSEFFATAARYADITTTAVGLDFDHIVTFLNKHTDAELNTLPTFAKAATPSGRSFTIKLMPAVGLHTSFKALPEEKGLARWLNRTRHPRKQGANIRYAYVAHESAVRRARTTANRGTLQWMKRVCVRQSEAIRTRGEIPGREEHTARQREELAHIRNAIAAKRGLGAWAL